MYERGRNTKFELTDVTTVFEERDDHAEPLTASEVAEELGCSRRTALNKLHELATRTELTSKKVGGRSRVWWIPIHA
jgi:MarR-like DNA-binding transcriptional regulator SgrR of sgrS sRNA